MWLRDSRIMSPDGVEKAWLKKDDYVQGSVAAEMQGG